MRFLPLLLLFFSGCAFLPPLVEINYNPTDGYKELTEAQRALILPLEEALASPTTAFTEVDTPLGQPFFPDGTTDQYQVSYQHCTFCRGRWKALRWLKPAFYRTVWAKPIRLVTFLDNYSDLDNVPKRLHAISPEKWLVPILKHHPSLYGQTQIGRFYQENAFYCDPNDRGLLYLHDPNGRLLYHAYLDSTTFVDTVQALLRQPLVKAPRL